MNFNRGVEVLRTGYFRLSPIGCFNDPFDGYGVAIGRMSDEACWHFIKRFRKELQRLFIEETDVDESEAQVLINATDEEYVDIVQEMLNNPRQSYFTVEAIRDWICAPRYQLMCLSSVDDYVKSNDILMWSHYADSCKGVRFEIEITESDILPGFSFRKMKYSRIRPVLNLENVTTWDDDDVEFKRYVEDCICMKSEEWHYESEVRFVADMKKCMYNISKGHDAAGDYDYACVKFPSDVIRTVCFGFATNRKTVKEVCKELRHNKCAKSMRFLQMDLDLRGYGIKYNEIQ